MAAPILAMLTFPMIARNVLGGTAYILAGFLSMPGMGQVRMWDIRTSGCVRVLDQHNTSAARMQCAPRPPVP